MVRLREATNVVRAAEVIFITSGSGLFDLKAKHFPQFSLTCVNKTRSTSLHWLGVTGHKSNFQNKLKIVTAILEVVACQ